MHLLRAAHLQVLGLVVSFRDFVYKRLFIPRVQAKQNLQTLSLFGDISIVLHTTDNTNAPANTMRAFLKYIISFKQDDQRRPLHNIPFSASYFSTRILTSRITLPSSVLISADSIRSRNFFCSGVERKDWMSTTT